ncbi:hypothetical protein D3C77_562650 [compost metagenome]
MKQGALWSSGYYRNRIVQPVGYRFRSFQRVDGYIHFWTAAVADFFSDIQHGGFIHLPFTNDYSTVNSYGIKFTANS